MFLLSINKVFIFKDMNNEIMELNRMEQGQAHESVVEIVDSPSLVNNENDSFGDCGDSYAYSVSESS